MTSKFEIIINGKPVEVSEELYICYMRSEWREHYRNVKLKSGKIKVDNCNIAKADVKTCAIPHSFKGT